MKGSIIAGLLMALATAEKYKQEKVHVSVDVPDLPSADLDSLYRSSGRFKDAKKAEFGAIRDAQEKIVTPTRSIDSLFLRLPSSEEIDELIISADSVALLKTVQTVATDDSLPCDQRVAYLLEVLGRVKAAIEKKTFRVEQLEVIIAGALQEIKRLEAEIVRLENEKNDLWLQELRDDLAKLVKDLEHVYNQFNAVEIQIPPLQGEVAGLEKEIQILTRNSDSERNRIAQEKLKLTETEALIRDIQTRLKKAKQQKATLEASIAKSEALIAENDKKVASAREAIRKLDAEIDELQDQADSLRARATNLEIQVERLRTDISVAETKEDRINAEIDRNIDRINFEKKKIAQDELDDLNGMIAALKELVPTTESEIDRHYYYCYGEGSGRVEQTGGVVVFFVKGERFAEYIHNAYGKTVKIPRVGDVELRRVDLFGATYTRQYGHIFKNHQVKHDFGCLNPSAARKSYGKIVAINQGYIEVEEHTGSHKQLLLGSCTRVECTEELPKVGHSIIYSTVADNLYKATCGNW